MSRGEDDDPRASSSHRGLLWRVLDRGRREPSLNRLVTRTVRALARAWPAASRFGRRHLRPLGWVVRHLPDGRRLALWTANDDLSVASSLFWRGWAGYEPETSPLFFALARGARRVVDVGANVGYFSLLAALARDDADVWAFEPLPANVDRLRKNLERNRASNVRVVALALSDREGTADFYVPRTGALSVRSALADDAGDAVHPKDLWGLTQVPVETFDGFAAREGIDHVDLVKIDVEGAETHVLRGMLGTLTRERPALVVEILTREAGEEVRRLLDPLGYESYRLTGDGPQRVVGDPERIHDWRNYVLIAPESHLWGRFQTCLGDVARG